MQSGLTETPNREFHPAKSRLSQPTTPQHGPGRSQPGLPDARSSSPDSQRSIGAESVGGLDVGQLDQRLGRLSAVEPKLPAANVSRAVVAGKRISDYENAVISASLRQNSRPPLGFKVVRSSRSDGVQLTDFPNGSFPRVYVPLQRPLT